MENLTMKALVARVCRDACASLGNGNGGNGSGGAHGAATAGMTYHSEPVSSPWNRVPDDMSKSADNTSGMTMSTMRPEDSSASTKTVQ
ncbi:hypothetical protein [Paraburkholderia sediminicola]|uniref:hypothetical protein n=1 Tax=Paraburkholderia sediminicola TaxID=458836 RepID=UPI0038B846C4